MFLRILLPPSSDDDSSTLMMAAEGITYQETAIFTISITSHITNKRIQAWYSIY
jgi:hypothetical protein